MFASINMNLLANIVRRALDQKTYGTTLALSLAISLALPITASAEEEGLDDLMSESLKEGKERKKAADEAEGKEDEPKKAEYVEDDSWESPPPDEEPPPKEKPKAEPEALNPPDGRRWQAGLLVSYGLETAKPLQGANQYGLGFGLQGGYTLDMGIYLGVDFSYYLGSTVPDTARTGEAQAGDNVNAFSFAAEFGYDIWMASAVNLRFSAQLGGIDTMIPQTRTGGGGRNFWTVYIGPGVSLLFPFSDLFYLGGDVRLPIVFDVGSGNSSLIFSLAGGARFE